MTYAQTKEAIRDICTPKAYNQIKEANKEIKRTIDLVAARSRTDYLGNMIVDYTFSADNCDDHETLSWDFWNGKFEE